MDAGTANNRKKMLGELLCEKSYLDESSLAVALEEQKAKPRPLGEILVDLGYITVAQLNEALALQVGIQRVDLDETSVGVDIIGLVPAELVSKYSIMPLWREDGRLAVAMMDPFRPTGAGGPSAGDGVFGSALLRGPAADGAGDHEVLRQQRCADAG